jgi:hypothetical protein
VAQLLSTDIHQQVFAGFVFTIQALNGILHGGGELSVGAAELLQQHAAEAGIGLPNANGKHQLLDVVIHKLLLRSAKRLTARVVRRSLSERAMAGLATQ